MSPHNQFEVDFLIFALTSLPQSLSQVTLQIQIVESSHQSNVSVVTSALELA